ncbi:MAG: molecular chaperone DnaJ [Firmicutes bacterium HGW-Firmicutes-1]|jgi:molecular chaperone DnaJ|nr:MAG: molecular chaperone DnaJ [Firmicutes bacterium HGW-Firmicutes-1]
MAEKKDYYETLGVSKGATEVDIKKAYRKLAKQHHPDTNPDDDVSEHKFKEATEAYEVLSDAEKRAKYDQFGHAAFDNGAGAGGFRGGFDFGDMGDVFGDIFGDFFGGSRRQSSNAPTKGANLRANIKLAFEEAVFGIEKEIQVTTSDPCDTCHGSGAKSGTSPEQCPTCHGAGQVRYNQQTLFGTVSSVKTCGQCQGSGKVIKEKCTDCQGSGFVRRIKKISVSIPEGIDNGQSIRLKGKGEPGKNGGPRGDILLTIYIEPHPHFERQDIDILYTMPITFAQAALGDELEVPTIDGNVKYEMNAGTQTNTRFRLKGKGVPKLSNPKIRGDQYVTVIIEVPKNLNDRQIELLKEFAAISKTISNEQGDKKKKWYDKVKDVFE